MDKGNRKVSFKNKDGDIISTDYDFLHLVPPQTAPGELSNLASPNSFIDVDALTLRHNKFDNIYALGDCANLPTAKTAAGVFSQVPVVVHNIER